MKEFQEIESKALEQQFRDISYWTRIHRGQLPGKIQKEWPARIIQDGISRIITYYDENQQYLCTMHMVVSKDGLIIHEDIKDALLNNIWYKCIKNTSN